jgi:hypothetical protein
MLKHSVFLVHRRKFDADGKRHSQPGAGHHAAAGRAVRKLGPLAQVHDTDSSAEAWMLPCLVPEQRVDGGCVCDGAATERVGEGY